MKTSELIKELQESLEINGDLDVLIEFEETDNYVLSDPCLRINNKTTAATYRLWKWPDGEHNKGERVLTL